MPDPLRRRKKGNMTVELPSSRASDDSLSEDGVFRAARHAGVRTSHNH